MTDLPLFYRTVVPLDRERHRTLALALPQRFDFARGSHVVPAVVDEFGAACRHLPIVFLPETLGPVPVFLTGLRPGRSALVDAQGAWIGRYLPAYLRRYPFILGEVEGAEPLICVDDTAPVFASAPAGGDPSPASPRPLPALPTGAVGLFDTASGDSVTLVERVRLVIDYAAAARRTEAFGCTLQDLALLRPLTIEGQDPASGARHALHGFTGVDEAALAGLSNAGIERLRAEGWLGSVHAHLVSLQTIGDFMRPFADPPASPVVGSDLVDAGLGAAA